MGLVIPLEIPLKGKESTYMDLGMGSKGVLGTIKSLNVGDDTSFNDHFRYPLRYRKGTKGNIDGGMEGIISKDV